MPQRWGKSGRGDVYFIPMKFPGRTKLSILPAVHKLGERGVASEQAEEGEHRWANICQRLTVFKINSLFFIEL